MRRKRIDTYPALLAVVVAHSSCAERAVDSRIPTPVAQLQSTPPTSSRSLGDAQIENRSVLDAAAGDAAVQEKTQNSEPRQVFRLGCTKSEFLSSRPELAQKMVDVVYSDEDYRMYICGDDPCSREEFETCLEFRQETLHEKPDVIGHYVEPRNKGSNMYTGVFILRAGEVVQSMIFFGTGIGADHKLRDARGFKLLRGREKRAPGTWVDYIFAWSGRAYGVIREEVVK